MMCSSGFSFQIELRSHFFYFYSVNARARKEIGLLEVEAKILLYLKNTRGCGLQGKYQIL